ncbi:RNA polymerase sigma-70 factor [Flammeovirga agarivorans]|uniref:RNA polymerase sigma-70 factor n=1 Tax=Flammeovirga agarivorans TaxID=2726742 RepID=A0A7X8SHF5_9BACT|nr:RNA polymerase sigma-70 factor [Flammeovirga agarivorans]NLR90207.1 RNA polymerase sigma-70 factor [Flammeovirga agarivorans]
MIQEIITKDKFEKLFREEYPRLCAYANTFLKDIEASEDVVHDVLFKLWENRESVNIDTSIEAYLFRAIRNKCLNVIRHLQVKEDYKSHNQSVLEEEAIQSADVMEASELNQKIHQAINSLPDKRKEVFMMSRFEGLKYAEIAEKLSISIKTVENQMSSALKYLKTELSAFISILIFILL